MKYIIRNLIKGEYDKWRKFATDLISENINKKLDYKNAVFRSYVNYLPDQIKKLDTYYQKLVVYYLAPDIIKDDKKQKEIYLENKERIDAKYDEFLKIIRRIESIDSQIWQLCALDYVTINRKKRIKKIIANTMREQ